MKTIKKLLVANRSEIAIRVFRSAHELGIRTVAIYSYEDRYALHRLKADEAYQIGNPGEPIRSYLDIQGIVELAARHQVDAIHPGYGFLSENPELARACEQAGINFVGPQVEALEQLGDKTYARKIAQRVGVPVVGGSDAIGNAHDGERLAAKLGFPVILKAAKGGGGRGMRVVHNASQFAAAFEQAQHESQTAFGSSDVFVEKYISKARHVEIQLLGDMHGNLFHLYERDCSIQRRHQKVVEIAPAPSLDPQIRRELCDAALTIGRAVEYRNAGTVEFLIDQDTGRFYFIEVNPRIQVEHTVTEEVTGIDIVRRQILIAQGYSLDDPVVGLGSQADIATHGFALQCRVTTEDASNRFLPDYGRIAAYRSPGGMGIRLDAGTAFVGAVVNPFYDSLLVKVTARGRTLRETASRMERCLQEFRVRGVKTNIPFLIRLVTHERFLNGDFTTRFIDESPELFDFPKRQDRATRILSYIGETIVNGNALVKDRPVATRRAPAPLPALVHGRKIPVGTRDKLKELGGPERFAKWVLEQRRLLLTDTTFRDAHQSLLATRFRTRDLLNIADSYAQHGAALFSIEMWGGATFDTSMRFLKECPWQRLSELREKIPNILFQMLLRASNAVGYTNYPDNVVVAFIEEAAQAGIDVFRVFDALNWTENMRVAMDAVQRTGAICEAAICYTGDILNPARPKYDLQYYVRQAKELERMGAHFLAIKDMSGLCKPYAAQKLVAALKQEIGIPIHFHTHDTAGIQASAILEAAEVGLDIADAAMAPMAGGTSQPNLNTVVEALRFTPRDPELDSEHLDQLAAYWQAVREFYLPFESEVLPATSDLYRHEMPGGQYTNLFEQARALGLADRWTEVCHTYAEVNQMLGDIVKVTPTSKAVGDMALFMVANGLTSYDVLQSERELAFPASVIDLIAGRMGQPPGGFPETVTRRILRGEPAFEGRPGASLPSVDFASVAEKLSLILQRPPNRREVISYLFYPKVFEEFAEHQERYSDTSHLPTSTFFYGQQSGQEIEVDIEPGKTLIVKYLTMSDPHPDGTRTVFFEMNGQPRDVTVCDNSLVVAGSKVVKADPADPTHIGAAMPGMVVTVAVHAGDVVAKGQKLLSLEAMKMETSIYAERDGKVGLLLVKPASQVDAGDLLLTLE